MPRFVILRHETPAGSDRETHFDLMLEAAGTLRTWALAELPSEGKELPAEALPDHRLAYLDYEGAVSGNRGSVTRIDAGEYDEIAEFGDLVQVRLAGKLLAGRLELRQSAAAPKQWTAHYFPAP